MKSGMADSLYDENLRAQELTSLYRILGPKTTTYHFNAGEMWEKTRFIREKNKYTIIKALPGEVEESPSD